MQSLNAQTITNEISTHIRKQGSNLSSWYVGITKDIDQRLFGDHNVPKDNHWRAHRIAISSNDARAAEKALINWGCDGGTGGGDNSAVFVYAYLKSPITNPQGAMR